MPTPRTADGKIDWAEYWQGIARIVASRGQQRDSSGGVVMVKQRRIRATGYASPGQHAPAAALVYVDPDDAVGATAHATSEPCSDCVQALTDAGVVQVVWPDGSRDLAGNER